MTATFTATQTAIDLQEDLRWLLLKNLLKYKVVQAYILIFSVIISHFKNYLLYLLV